MDPEFYAFVGNELRVLLDEFESGQEPSNISLYEVVMTKLRRDYQHEKIRETLRVVR